MKKLFVLLCILFAVCSELFAVTYAEGKTLNVYPDTVLSGDKFAIQFEPNKKTAMLNNYGSAKTIMVMGDKTGTSEIKIELNGCLAYDSMVKLFESNTELYLILAADKGFVAKATFSKIDGKDFSARLSKVGSAEYIVGGAGPAGGIIFYDKGEYSDGWRYLEAAPADLRAVVETPTVDKSDPWYDFGEERLIFGYYRLSHGGNNLFVNGSRKYYESDCTGTAIGTGRKNTELLVKAMGNSAYSSSSGSEKTSAYAAKLCSDLVYNGFDDWFLPSKDELNLMYTNLHKNGQGDFANYGLYWSSSENYNYTYNAWEQNFNYGSQYYNDRDYSYRVRPVRAF